MSLVTPPRRTGAVELCSSAIVRSIVLLAALVAALAGAPAAAQAATDPTVTQQDLCRAWSASATNPQITLASGLSVSADRLTRVGSSCLAAGAQIRLTGTEVKDPAPAGPGGTATAQVLAAVMHAAGTTPDLKEGDELFKGAHLTNFNAVLKLGYFEISGAVNIDWTGGTVSRFLFKGKLFGVDKFSMSLYSPVGGTTLPNVGGTPVSYTGTLTLNGKRYALDLAGSAPSITVGAGTQQLTVTNAQLALSLADTADGNQALHLDVTGLIGLGSAVQAQGTLHADFDGAGLTTLSGNGALSVTIPAKGSSPAGSVSGSIAIAYTKAPASTSITFTGDVRLGEALVTGATGTLDDQSASFAGNVEYTNAQLTAKGAIDGVVYYGDALDGRTIANKAGVQVQAQKGDALLKTASGELTTKGITVAGAAQIGNVGTERWVTGSGAVDLTFQAGSQPETTIKGSASVDWLVGQTPSVAFTGSIASGSTLVANAKGALDGKKISFSGDVSLVNPDLTVKGAVDGTVYYGSDLSGETVKDHSGASVPASKGDFVLAAASASINTKGFALSGAATLGRVGGDRWATGSGSVDTTYGATRLKGSAGIDWVAGGIPAVTFDGSVTSGGLEIASAKGDVDGNRLALKGAATLTTPGLSVKGSVDGIVYYGSDLSGQTITNRAGADVPASKGDVLVKSASADVNAKGLALSGAAQVGSVGGELWAKGGGSVDLTFGATNLKGSATVEWVSGQVPAVGFSGGLTSGTTTVANATGTFDANKIAFKGDAALTEPSLALKGAVDGVLFYGSDLSGESVKNRAGTSVQPAKGDFVLTSASGAVTVKNLALTGNLAMSKVAGAFFISAGGSVDLTNGATNIKGAAQVSWATGEVPAVSFDGAVTSGDTTIASAKGSVDGKKIAFAGTATVTNASLSVKGAVDGVVFYGPDLAGETVSNHAGAKVPATKGDLFLKSASGQLTAKGITASGNVQLGRVGSEQWVTGGGAVDTTFGATALKGSAAIDWVSGQVPSVSFSGSVVSGDTTVASASGSFDGKKIALKGDASLVNASLTLKGGVDAVVYYGSDLTGETVANKAGTQIQAVKGDLVLKSASATINTKGFALTGAAQVGLLSSQKWVTGGGAIDTTFGATALKGSATVDWTVGQIPAVAFSGSVTNGTTLVAGATGVIDGKKIALKGNATVNDPGTQLTGAVDGVLFYGDDLTGETIADKSGALVQPLKGDYNLKGASGSLVMKGLSASGGLSIGNVRGVKWASGGGSIDLRFTQPGQPETRIQGSASATPDGNVAFTGSLSQGDTQVASVSGSADGKKLTFAGQLSTPTLSGKATGVVYYGTDLSGQTIVNRAGATVPASRGDLSLDVTDGRVVLKQLIATASFTAKRVGTEWWVKTNAQLKVAQTWLAFAGEIDSAGNVNLTGSGAVNFDGTIVSFTGTATVKNGALVLAGSGTLKTGLFSATVSGTIQKPDMNTSQYVLTGTVSFKFGIYQVAGASVRLTFGEGLTTSFTLKICVLFICPQGTYKLYFAGTEISRIELQVSLLYWATFRIAAAVVAPNVPISSTITGII